MENAMSEAVTRDEARGSTPRPGLREWLLTRWLRRIRVGRLTVEFPSGTRKSFEGPEPGPHALLKINDLRFVLRILVSGEIGLAEGYMENEWDTPDLRSLLTLGVLNGDAFSDALGQSWIMKAINRLRHDLRANTRSGSRRNIAAHYDLGNEFYGLWLDETMTYSSALFMDLDEPLLEAQRRKYLRLAEKLDLRPGERILEIGCGWGGFAEIAAAEFGCEVVGLTLSVEQAAYCHDRMARAFEAVGEEYWPTYLDVLRNRLKPEGRAALQIITIDDRRFAAYRRGADFVQRYIFPGGMLPSPQAFSHAASTSSFKISDAYFFGKSYAETLRRWDRMFQANRAEVQKQGFDQRFCRMWHYYLRYCEVGFEREQIDVGQFVIERV
jgi:cyclopropane-fatty-acyl-phospholipid synthase